MLFQQIWVLAHVSIVTLHIMVDIKLMKTNHQLMKVPVVVPVDHKEVILEVKTKRKV